MKPTALLSTLALSLALALGGAPAAAAEPAASAPTVQIQQIRNATLKLEYAGRTFLVDPMLGARAATRASRAPTTSTCPTRRPSRRFRPPRSCAGSVGSSTPTPA